MKKFIKRVALPVIVAIWFVTLAAFIAKQGGI